MAELLLPLIVPASAGGLGWWFAHLCAPLKAANDNGPVRVTLPHPHAGDEGATPRPEALAIPATRG